MMTRLLRVNVLVPLIVALLSGCGPNKAEQEVGGFVQNYCSVLQDAYARADLRLLQQMATENEVKKLVPVIQILSSTGNSMKTEILEFRLKKARVSDGKATVQTSEKWRYWWTDNKSGAITRPRHEESYDLQYNLVRVNGSWRLDSMKNLKE